jgi:hypothetical protein
MFGPLPVVLFWEVLETLGGGAKLEEVGHWVRAFEGYTWSPVPSLPLPVGHEISSLLLHS